MSSAFHTKCTAAPAAKTCNELFIWWIILLSPLLEYPIARFHFCFRKIYYSEFFSLDNLLNISCPFSPSYVTRILFPGSTYPSALTGSPNVGKLWGVQFLPRQFTALLRNQLVMFQIWDIYLLTGIKAVSGPKEVIHSCRQRLRLHVNE